MPRVDPLKVAFNSGEFSPRMAARVDFNRYPDAGETVRNLLPLPQGGAARRPGTRHVASARNTGKARLIPFQFSTTQAYVLEAGSGYMRFYRNQGQIVVGNTDASITNGTFDSNLAGWTVSAVTWSGGRAVFDANGTLTQQVTITTDPTVAHVIRFAIGGTPATDTLAIRVGTTAGGEQILADAVRNTGLHCVEFTPGAGNTTFYVQFRRTAGAPELDDVDFLDNQSVELVSPYSESLLFDLQWAQSADVMWIVHPNYKPRKLSRFGHASWSLIDYSPASNPFTSTNLYPSVVSFFEQRIWFANSNNDPQKVWASKSGDFEDMTTGANDDDALTYTIATGEVNAIRWLSSAQALLMGTVGGEFSIDSDGPVITPTDIQVRRQSRVGSATVAPVQIGSVTLFLQRALRKVRRLQYFFESDGYRADDLTILADHITDSGIVEMDYQQEPDSLLWCVRTDGVLAALTFKPEEQVVGWARHIIGGRFGAGNAVVESVAVIPGNAAGGSAERDELWMVVKRTVNGQTVRYVEFLEKAFDGPLRDDYASDGAWEAAVVEAQKGALYVDSGATYDGAATTTVTGLSHLEGETVKVLADGAIHPDRTVSSGQIALERAASKVQVGLPYTHTFKSLKLDAGNPAGTSVGKVKRFHALTLVLLNSATYSIGRDGDTLEQVEFREVGDAMDTAVPLFTGEKRQAFQGQHDRDARFVIQGDAPLPFTVLAVAPELRTAGP